MAILFSDDFNRANGAAGANYSYQGTGTAPAISSNQLTCLNTSFNGPLNCIGAGVVSGDHYAEAVCSGDIAFGICWAADGDDGYFVLNQSGTSSLRRWDNQSTTVLSALSTIANGSVVRMAREGNDIVVYDDGVEIGSVTDTTYMSGYIALNGNNGSSTFDNLVIGRVDVGSPSRLLLGVG